MPVRYLTDDDTRLLAYHFSSTIVAGEVIEAVSAVAAQSRTDREYRSLLVFDRTTDLSEITATDLQEIKRCMVASYEREGLRRPLGAIVVDGSLDAKMIMPLWKAICDADPNVEVRYRFFIDVPSALDWLDVVESPSLASLLAGHANL